MELFFCQGGTGRRAGLGIQECEAVFLSKDGWEKRKIPQYLYPYLTSDRIMYFLVPLNVMSRDISGFPGDLGVGQGSGYFLTTLGALAWTKYFLFLLSFPLFAIYSLIIKVQ